jgi:hypothetical protein
MVAFAITLAAISAPAAADPLAIGGFESGLQKLFKDGQAGVAFFNASFARTDVTLNAGVKFAMFGPRHEPGFRALISAGTKFRERDPLMAERFNRFTGGKVLVGYEWHHAGWAATVLAGASLIMSTPADQSLTRREHQFGGAVLVDLWRSWQPDDGIPAGFTALTLVGDQAEESVFARIRHGFTVHTSGLAIGPEASVSAGRERKSGTVVTRAEWVKSRLGAHMTGLRFGPLGLNLSAGYEFRRREKGSPYAEFTTLVFY